MLRSFLKDNVIYAIPAFISSGLALFLIPLYTRVLSPEDYGLLDLLIVLASIVNLTIALEVSQGVARFYTAESDLIKKDLYFSSALWFTIICYFIFSGMALCFSGRLSELIFRKSGLNYIFELGVVYIFINGIFLLLQSQFRWQLRSINYAVVSLFSVLSTSSISIWLVYYWDWGLAGLLIGMISGALIAGVLAIWWLRQSIKFKINTEQLREMLIFSAPLVFSGVAVWVSLYVDRMMISYYLTVEEVGLYGIGYRLASVAALIMVGFKSALTPLIYANYHKPSTPSDLEKIFRFFLYFSLLLFLFISLFSLEILQAFTTPPFYSASVVVVYLVPAILLQSMYIFSPGISIEKKTKFIIWINFTGCVLNIIFNYLLIPIYGISGAAVATMIGYGVVFALYTIIGNKFYPIPHRWPQIYAAVGFAASISIALPYLTSHDKFDWFFKILSILCFAVFASAVGLIKKEEFLSLWFLMKKKFIKWV